MHIRIITVFLSILAFGLTTPAYASILSNTAGAPGLPVWESAPLSWELNWHMNSGETRELVFYDEALLSELRWPTPLAVMLDHHFTYQLNKDIPLYFTYSHLLYADNGFMEDRDWGTNKNSPLTAYSASTSIMKRNDELNIFTSIPIFSRDIETSTDMISLSARGIGGHRYHTTAWTSMGGGQVSNERDPEGLGGPHDYYMSFDPRLQGISYTHTRHMPFFGSMVNLSIKNVDMLFSGIFSPWVNSLNTDIHHYRALVFIDTIHNAKYFELGFATRYHISKTLQIGMNYSYDHLFKKRGPIYLYDLIDGDSQIAYSMGSVASASHSVRFGFRYTF